MRKAAWSRASLARLILFLAVAGIHATFILFFVIQVAVSPVQDDEEEALVMKLLDLAEEEPPPDPLPYAPPPPPEYEYTEPAPNTVEAVAETMIETDEEPDQTVVSGIIAPRGSPSGSVSGTGQDEYLPMGKISVAPVFSEDEIRDRLIYPPIALRAKLEGIVYLELFVDRRGQVQRITVLRENPENRGFAEAAVKAFEGIQGTPAQANGATVAVRYRYPVRFAIRG